MAEPEVANSLVEKAKFVIELIRKLPPKVDPTTYARRLNEIAAMSNNWERGDDRAIRGALDTLSQDLNRMRRLKRGGISALPEQVASPLGALVQSLKSVGVFLAPVGELEGWLASEAVEASKANKAAWANAAALRIQSKGPAKGDIWDFVREVGRYLEQSKLRDP